MDDSAADESPAAEAVPDVDGDVPAEAAAPAEAPESQKETPVTESTDDVIEPAVEAASDAGECIVYVCGTSWCQGYELGERRRCPCGDPWAAVSDGLWP